MRYASNIKGQTWAERYNIDRLSKSVLILSLLLDKLYIVKINNLFAQHIKSKAI